MKATGNAEQTDSIQDLSFEEALEQLEAIVRALESGQGELEQSINQYARGAELKKHCEEKLENARARIEKIVMTADGRVSAEDMNPE